MIARVRILLVGLITVWGCIETLALSYLLSPARFHSHFTGTVTRWANGLLWALGVRVTQCGPLPDLRKHPLVLVSNHQSLVDIPVLLSLLPEIRIIAKKELFRIPLFGRAMRRAGFLEIDRSNRARAFHTIDEAAERVRAGTSILVFAEGTRSRDDHIQPFKKGAFVLATSAQVAVVPVAVRGANRRLPKGALSLNPGTVHVAFGAPLPPSPPEKRAALLSATEQAVRSLYSGLPES